MALATQNLLILTKAEAATCRFHDQEDRSQTDFHRWMAVENARRCRRLF